MNRLLHLRAIPDVAGDRGRVAAVAGDGLQLVGLDAGQRHTRSARV
jgi:hypothetical protein